MMDKVCGQIVDGGVRKAGRDMVPGEVFLYCKDPWMVMAPKMTLGERSELHPDEFAAVNLSTGEYTRRWNAEEDFVMLEVVKQPEFKRRK
jgi:hypothetical protein